jgi:hypothetical protein
MYWVLLAENIAAVHKAEHCRIVFAGKTATVATA